MDEIEPGRVAAAEAAPEESWVKPELASYAPVAAAEGIWYNPTDGLSNLTN